VLAATFTTVVVFFPVTLLYGVSKFLFSALALGVVISLFASFFVAMTVVPLFCARWIHMPHATPATGAETAARPGWGARFHYGFNHAFERMLRGYDRLVVRALQWPRATLAAGAALLLATLAMYPLLGTSFFPRTDAGQFVINVKAPLGSNLDTSEREMDRLAALIRGIVSPHDLDMIVSNIGVNPGFSALFSPNSAMHTSFVQVSLKPGHRIGSYEYIDRVREKVQREMPELTTFFSSGSLVDGVVNMGLPAPIDVQVAGTDLAGDFRIGQDLMARFRQIPGVADVYMPQDLDAPSLRLTIDRTRALEMGLTEKEVVSNVITALTSNTMIAPSIWIDPKNGNNYFLVAQYTGSQVKTIDDLRAIPLHRPGGARPTRLDMVAEIERFTTPTELDHYQIRRQIDILIRPEGEDLAGVARQVEAIAEKTRTPVGIDLRVAGSVKAMEESFHSFAIGLGLAVVLLYLILVAQFRSFLDPWIILLALPPGLSGVILTLWLTRTTLNVMSLMGVVMLAGIALSNSILIVEFAHRLIAEGAALREAISTACRVRLRPILMTSLATVIGLLPMALKLGEGSEAYAPLARALIGGLLASVALAIFLVPAGFVLAYDRRRAG
jgi:multidrug efflux pump subunit AcrB